MSETTKTWPQVAMEMISELRDDYAPGTLGELEGVKAIRKLRKDRDAALARIATLEAALKAVDAKLSYLQKLWGKEGLTDGLVDQIRAALEPKP